MFDYKQLKLIERRSIEMPKQKISRKPLWNVAMNSVTSVLEGCVLGIRKDSLGVEEMTYHNPMDIKFSGLDTLRVRRYMPKSDSGSAVVVLPQRGGGYNFAQLVASYLARNNIVAYEIETPLRPSRLPKGVKDPHDLKLTLDNLRDLFFQAIAETRGLIDLIEEETIGICGVSLGAIYSSVLYGIDDRLKSACLILGGGDLVGMVKTSNDRFAREIRAYVEAEQISDEELRGRLSNIEPCNNTSPGKARNLLMINATLDRDVPEEYGRALAEAWGDPQQYFIPSTHLGVIRHVPKLLPLVLKHFQKTL